jgi:CarD family transcriptional regulator
MIMTIGKKIIYPSQGPCLVNSIVQKSIGEGSMSFYQLLVLHEGGGDLFIPVDKTQIEGIRPLLHKSEIPKVLNQLKRKPVSDTNYRDRARNNLKLMASGSAFDLAEVVESLTELRETKNLSFSEHKMLEKARELLVCEISEVMGESKAEAQARVDKALGVQ